jgi:chaperonin cofactor prefoldin
MQFAEADKESLPAYVFLTKLESENHTHMELKLDFTNKKLDTLEARVDKLDSRVNKLYADKRGTPSYDKSR